jgi:DNA-binding transcriptional MerR regulator
MDPMSLNGRPDLLSIGAFAQRSRLSLKALRLYAELGLLPPAAVDRETGYRYYAVEQIERARLIGLLRRLDMPLARIGRVLELEGVTASQEVAAFWAEAEASVAVKQRLVAYLERHLEGRGESMYEVQTREVPEQEVMSITRSLTVADLVNFIMESNGELSTQLERAGATPTMPWFVVYHGEVNEDSDGPVEVCLPYSGSVTPQGEAALRREPAHREAYTTLTTAQTVFPQILDAYGAVDAWVQRNGLQLSAPPREVYFTEAEPKADEPFCDVAFPIA